MQRVRNNLGQLGYGLKKGGFGIFWGLRMGEFLGL